MGDSGFKVLILFHNYIIFCGQFTKLLNDVTVELVNLILKIPED